MILLGLQLYQDLYSFINIDKINMIIAHVGLLQVWIYEHIIVVRLVGLQRMQNDMIDACLVCWKSLLGGYRPPQIVEVRSRQIDDL